MVLGIKSLKIGEDMDDDSENLEGIMVEEHIKGKYDCLEFILSTIEKKRIYKYWRREVTVKLLGRRIGHKTL